MGSNMRSTTLTPVRSCAYPAALSSIGQSTGHVRCFSPQVSDNKEWREIAKLYDLPPSCTNAAYQLKACACDGLQFVCVAARVWITLFPCATFVVMRRFR